MDGPKPKNIQINFIWAVNLLFASEVTKENKRETNHEHRPKKHMKRKIYRTAASHCAYAYDYSVTLILELSLNDQMFRCSNVHNTIS